MKSERSWGRLGMKSEYRPLKSLVRRKIGYGIVQPGKDNVGEVHLIKVNNIISGLKNIEDLDRTTSEIEKKYERTRLKGGELVISVVGTPGRTAIVPKSFAGCNLVRAVALIDIVDCLTSWVKYYIDSPNGQNYILQNLNTTVQPTLNIKDLSEMPILIMDRKKMESIVSILSAIDRKIEFNNRINENLESQAQAIFKSWFVDFEPFGGVMPEDWSECILDSMCSLIIKGITPKYNEHSAQLVINQKCVRNHQIDLSLARCHEPKKVNEKWLQYGDIVVNSTGTGTLGRAAQVLFTPNNMTVDSHVTIIRASKQEYIYYLGLWATSHEHDFEMLQTGSTGQTDLPRERLKQMQIVLPSDSILSSFSKVIKPIADIRIQKQQETQRLSALRDTLLPKLMNGEIDVSAVQI